ncbi:MAG: histidine kinase [Deltaproteobacteria bacterium]
MLQLRRLTLELSQTEQRERQRLATILHNDLQQILVAMRLRLEKLTSSVHTSGKSNILKDLNDLLGQAVSTTRNLASELRPPILNNANILESLRWLANWIEKRFGFSVQLSLREDLQTDKLADEAVVILFDAARELLFNVVKHAGVKDVSLVLDIVDHDYLLLCISDKGSGIDAKQLEERLAKPSGLGLASIRDRLKLLGGRLALKSAEGQGFHAEILIPYDLENAKAGSCLLAEGNTAASTLPETQDPVSQSRPGWNLRRKFLLM